MGGVPFDATHEQVDSFHQQLAEAARAQDVLKNIGNQAAFKDNYEQLTRGNRADGFPIPQQETVESIGAGLGEKIPTNMGTSIGVGSIPGERINSSGINGGGAPSTQTGGQVEQDGRKQDGGGLKHSPGTTEVLNKIHNSRELVADLVDRNYSQSFGQDIVGKELKNPKTVDAFKDVLSVTADKNLFDGKDDAGLAEVLITHYNDLPADLKSGFDAKLLSYIKSNLPANHPVQGFINSGEYTISLGEDDKQKMAVLVKLPTNICTIRNSKADNIPRVR